MGECPYVRECKQKEEKYSPKHSQKEVDLELTSVEFGPWFKCYNFGTKKVFFKYLKKLGYKKPEELSCFDGRILGKLALAP